MAIGFSYDENEMGNNPDTNHNQTKPIDSPDQNQASKEFEGEPYICPPELILPPDMILPEFDRQAAIIEKTAIFIARNNAQMEIVLKTKQSNNFQFKFLNYDDKLNPFYKELVKLIKSGRYIPRHRPNTSDSSKIDSEFIGDDINPDEPYELKLPKVDISNTAYASLINRFKKSNEEKIISNSSEIHNGSKETNVLSDNRKVPSTSDSIFQEPSKAEQPAVPVITNEDYERFYQEYYRHYYSYYYMHYSSSAVSSGEAENESWVVSESARAAATAALAAVNAVRQSQLAFSSSSSSPPADLRSIIDKMAEYVVRNGDEFQNVVKSKKQDDPRFAFLQTGHIHHDYYIVKKKEFAAKFHKSEQENDAKSSVLNTNELKNQEVKDEKSSLSSSVKNKSISFRLTKSSSSNRLKEMEETTGSAVANDEENPAVADAITIPQSAYYNALPGICNYSSDTESEGEQEELVETANAKRASSGNSPVENVTRTEEVVSNFQPANLTAAPQASQLVTSHRNRVDSPPSSHPTSNGKTAKSLTIGTLLSAEEIARDIQSMEEEARQQLERRKRAALFAAKLQAAKLRKLEEKVAEEQKKKCETPSPPPPPINRLTSTAAPPPPPSSVPAAVANAVAAQLKTQREKALESAATAAASKESERNKFARRVSRSPPAAYAKHRRKSLSRSPSGGEKSYTRSRRRRSRSPPSSHDHSSRRSRHKRL